MPRVPKPVTKAESPKSSPKPSSKPEPRVLNAKEALAALRGELTRKYKENVMTTFSGIIKPIPVIPTGIVSFDKTLGVGGFPRGRVTEFYGPPGCGKTTLCLHTIVQCQRMGEMALFLDYEHALDLAYAKALGVNFDEELFQMAQPSCLEEGADILRRFLKIYKSVKLGLVIVDSIASMVPRKELDGDDIGAATPGLQALLVSRHLKQITGAIRKSNIAMIGVNQPRSKISTMGAAETTPGGNALKHAASIRCDMRRTKLNETKPRPDKHGNISLPKMVEPTKVAFGSGEAEVTTQAYSQDSRFKIIKSKVANPFRMATCTLVFGKGYDRVADIWEVCMANRLFKPWTTSKKIMCWSIADDKNTYELKFQNQEDFTKIFKDNPTYVDLAYKVLMKHSLAEHIDLTVEPEHSPESAIAAEEPSAEAVKAAEGIVLPELVVEGAPAASAEPEEGND